MRPALSLLLCGLALGCVSSGGLPPLATASAAPDMATYELRRVAMLPLAGEQLDEQHAASIQGAFHLELGRSAPYELVRLTPEDLDEVYTSEPHRRGSYHPRTLLELARRYRVDAVLIGTVTQFDVYPPQVLALDLVLVSCETGMILWTSNVHLDASDALVREHLDWYQRSQAHSGDWEDGVQLTLISPTHFARFAASEVAKQL
jgi:hypothetical protein